MRVGVGKFRPEQPLSLWFGNGFLAFVLQTVTHLQSYFIPSLIFLAFLWSSLITVFRIQQCIVCVCVCVRVSLGGRWKINVCAVQNQRYCWHWSKKGSLWLNLYSSVRFIVWAVCVFLTATLPTTLTLEPITSSKHRLHSFVPTTMTVHRWKAIHSFWKS